MQRAQDSPQSRGRFRALKSGKDKLSGSQETRSSAKEKKPGRFSRNRTTLQHSSPSLVVVFVLPNVEANERWDLGWQGNGPPIACREVPHLAARGILWERSAFLGAASEILTMTDLPMRHSSGSNPTWTITTILSVILQLSKYQ